MNNARFLRFGGTILVTCALFAGVPAFAKKGQFDCQNQLVSVPATEIEIRAAQMALDVVYARGLQQNRTLEFRAERVDALLTLVLQQDLDVTLAEAAQEYALATMTLSSFCGPLGVITDEHRLRAATSAVSVASWVSREREQEILRRIRGLLANEVPATCAL